MTALTMGLLIIGGLIGLVGWIWLLVAAFRTGIGWGMLILLLSWSCIPVIIFAVRHWESAKRPIMLWVVGFLVSLAGYLIAFSALGMETSSSVEETSEVTARPDTEIETESSLLPPQRPTAEPTHPSWEAVVREMDKADQAGKTDNADWEAMVPSPTPATGRPSEGLLNWDELPKFTGRTLILELDNNTIMTAKLESVEPGRVRMRHVIGGGEASYWIERDQIERIRVAN
jgi:hypothetical protein